MFLARVGLDAIALFVLVTTLLAFSRSKVWWIRIWDFPRLQLAVLGLLVVAARLAIGAVTPLEWALVVGAAVATGYQLLRIVPYCRPYPKQVAGARSSDPDLRVRLLVSNVFMDNRDASRLLAVIHEQKPDLVLTVETDPWWERQLRVLEADYPYQVKVPLANTYGMLLYSRYRLIDPEVRFLIQDDIPSIHTLVELPSGVLVDARFVHPRPPSPTEADDSKPRDAELVMVAKLVRGSPHPVIVAGDLNDVAWSRTTSLFQRIAGLLDPRIGRQLCNSFSAKLPLVRFPLDHVFFSPDFRVVELARMPHIGSDHFPVLVEISCEARAVTPALARPPRRLSEAATVPSPA